METVFYKGSPVIAVLFVSYSVGIQEKFHIRKGRGILFGDIKGQMVKQVQVHEVVFVPVCEPDRFYARVLSKFFKPLPIRSRIDEDLCFFDVDGVTVRIFSAVFPRNKPDGPEMFFCDFSFHFLNLSFRFPRPVSPRKDPIPWPCGRLPPAGMKKW